MVPQVLEVLVPTISGFTTDREAKLEAGKSEAPVIRQTQQDGGLGQGNGKYVGFEFVLKVELSTGFADESAIRCYWREREE